MSGPRAKTPPLVTPGDTGTRPVVVLCGFMSTGKTTVGRALASMLGVPFFDTDALIESRAGASVAEIFARDGEPRFRELEADVCRAIGTAEGAVIATGGGTILDAGNFRHLSSLGTMVLLEASIDAIVRRAVHADVRPRLPVDSDGHPDAARTAALLEERRAAYDRIAWRIDTSVRTSDETAFEILERLRHRTSLIHMRADVRPILGHVPRPGETRLARIVVGRDAITHLGDWMREIGLEGPAFVMSSRRVAGFHGRRLRETLDAAGINNRFIEINDDENAKTLDQTEQLLYQLADSGATRDTTVIALGGGVTGDVAGFVAATYMRGLSFVQIPTTLLAQVDSSIGGKVGVNHPRAKNLIGTLHQPQLVLADVSTLSTLPPRQLASGWAEVVKTSIIGAPTLFETLHAAGRDGSIGNDPEFLEEAVSRCARVKARIVESDPYERGARRVLNLGHTLGHALETVAGYGTMLHGEAVALGMLAAIRVSRSRGLATSDFETATQRILAACGLYTTAPDMPREAIARAMSLDKKRRARGLVFVLPVAPGDVRVVDDVTEDEILAAVNG
jgi:3-dehydroquinate synthase